MDSKRRGHAAPDAGACEPEHAAREAASRRYRGPRSATSSRAACGRSRMPSRTRRSSKSAKRNLLFEQIIEEEERRAAIPRRACRRYRRSGDEGQSHEELHQEGCRGDLQGHSSARRSRSMSGVPMAAAPTRSRPIEVEVGVNPRAHGSGLFTRGQTQDTRLSTLTLGTAKEGQRIDDLSLESDRRYMHHYNFPPFSVGETGFMRGPKRRDIGHGALAQRALEAMIPPATEFPYTIRIVSETLESNGSSSMGSVCGSTLFALMDAGVPIKARGLRHRDGPREGRRRLRDPDRASRVRRTTSATWTSRSPGPGTASPRSKWTSRSPVSRRRSWKACTRAGKPGAQRDRRHHARRHSGVRARGFPRTRRGSRRSRSTRRRSSWVIGKGGGERSAASRLTTRCRSTSRRTARSSYTPPTARRPRRRSPRSRR